MIRLHKDHGLNPTMPTCFYCGESKNEIALLGAASKKITGEEKAPMHGPVIDMEPCDNCKDYMKQGVILIGVVEEKTHNEKNPYRSGHFMVVKDDVVRRNFNPEMAERVIESRCAFIDHRIVTAMDSQYKGMS